MLEYEWSSRSGFSLIFLFCFRASLFWVFFVFVFIFFFFLTSGLIFECENPTYAPVMIICWIDNFFWGGTVIS